MGVESYRNRSLGHWWRKVGSLVVGVMLEDVSMRSMINSAVHLSTSIKKKKKAKKNNPLESCSCRENPE